MALLLTTTTLPGLLTKTAWFVNIRLSTVNLKVKSVLQIAQHMTKQVKKLHTSKVKHTQTEQSEHREIVINRSEYSRIQSIYTNYAKITRYSMSKNKACPNEYKTLISENLSKGMSSTS